MTDPTVWHGPSNNTSTRTNQKAGKSSQSGACPSNDQSRFFPSHDQEVVSRTRKHTIDINYRPRKREATRLKSVDFLAFHILFITSHFESNYPRRTMEDLRVEGGSKNST